MAAQSSPLTGPIDPRDTLFSTDALDSGSVAGRATRGALLTVLSTALKIVVQFGSIAILARLVPPNEFGVVAMAMPIVAIAVSLSRFGLAQAIVQRPHVTHALATTLFWANLTLATVVAAVVFWLSPLAGAFYGDPRVPGVFAALTLSILFAGAVTQYMGILRRQMRFKVIEACTLTAELVGMVAAVIAATYGASYWAIVLQHVLIQAVALAGLGIATGWLPSLPPLRAVRWREARSSIALGGYLAGFGLLNQVLHGLGSVISGRVLGDVAAAAYFRAWTLGYYPEGRFGSPLAGVFVPALSRATGDAAAFRALYATLLRRLSLFLMPVGAVFLAGGDVIVAIVLGSQWQAAQPLLMWLGLMVLLAPLSTSVNWALTAVGATRQLMVYGLLSLIAVGGALMVGAERGLVTMTAAYTLTGLLVQGPMLLVLAIRYTPLQRRTVADRYGRDLVVFLALAGLAYLLREALAPLGLFQALGPLGVISPLIVVGAAVGMGSAAYGLLDPALRPDLMYVIRRVLPSR